MAYNKVTWACSLRSGHGIHFTGRLRPVAFVPLLVLCKSMYYRSRHCSSKGGAVPPKVTFLVIVVALLEACKLWANIPLVWSPTLVAPNPALLGRRLPRLEMGPRVGFPPLFMPVPGSRWSSHSLLVWALSLHLHLHLLHDPSLLHQGCKVLDG